MNGHFSLVMLLFVTCSAVNAEFQSDYSYVLQHHKRYWDRLDDGEISKIGLKMRTAEAKEFYLTQPLDHFDVMTTRTYQQRYLVVDRYWRQTDGPVFLYIGGEWTLSQTEVTNGQIADMAETYGALILGVEHRFYGKSLNSDGMELNQLNYLSSHQALADLVSFHGFATKKFELTPKNLWISFGCSYPGALTAWFRLKYPHLVHGAVSSSGPLRAQANFQGYNEVVTAAFGDPVALGSKQCVSRIVAGFDTIDTMIKTGKLSDLQQAFNVCQSLTVTNDLKFLASTLQNIFMRAVQYNTVELDRSDIGNICDLMTNETAFPDPFEALKAMSSGNGGRCVDVSYDHFINYYSNTSVRGWRPWGYQTCTQYGYYQTCDSGTSCMFLDLADVHVWLQVCKDIFEVDGPNLLDHVDFTNMFYGAEEPWGSRIVFVNGDLDPWHSLGIKKDLSNSMKSVMIRAGSHCQETRIPTEYDSDELKAARVAIENEVKEWLQSPRYHRDECPMPSVGPMRHTFQPALIVLGLLLGRCFKLYLHL